jgi:predicted nucleic acid-binding protein
METTIVITDASVLINFLVLDRVGLLSRLTSVHFVVTEHVRAEITEHFPEQLQRLNVAFETGVIEEISVTDIVEVALFADLTSKGLGVGECSAIAVAVNRKLTIAIDDKRALKKVARLGYNLEVLGTEQLVVQLIAESVLTIVEADQMKDDWEQNYRFKLSIVSFSEHF